MRTIPVVTKNLLICNVLAFFLMYVLRSVSGIDLNDLLGLHFLMASDFHIYQLVTYMFMHANIEHILFNMFALWMFGCVVERVWGPQKFLFYYISCGIGAGLLQEAAQFGSIYFDLYAQTPIGLSQAIEVMHANASALNGLTTVGASGAIYAILLAFGMLFPEERIFIFPLPVPIKAKWFVCGYAAIELFSALATPGDNVAHLAHLGGMLFGFLIIRYWQRHPAGANRYGRSHGEQFFQNLRNRWEQRTGKSTDTFRSDDNTPNETDWDYNARKKNEQEEIDQILDKIRKSGYDSLTKAEKQRLFEQSKR
ncbi:rhomboid family intramembrane serine protease [Hoylesella enoeca]|uniref:rhomboid family intramembrane serine protease n=1 Tax=Hoylesella enoeca TaxID=76123 RepID=UPI00288A493D|nr:rhomboid family intramembrane serine protease [Hoylesella enoeca]